MTASMKRQLVNRLVGHNLRGWNAGREAGLKCALDYLLVDGFLAVIALENPSFRKLKATLRHKGDSDRTVDEFWEQLAGPDHRTATAHPDFPKAFIEAVREMWGEVCDDVTAELDACPRSRQTSEPAAVQGEETPVRRGCRRPSRRRASPRPDDHRRW